MDLQKIIYRSETYIMPAHIVGQGTWAEMHIPEKTMRRYYITYVYSTGETKTTWTNGDGEGLFSVDNSGAEYQITGTSQFCISGTTPNEVKRNITNRHKQDIDNGVTIEFDFDDF